jgi:nitrite reductase/ring-hydroxylating ferredoxin subunit
MLAGVEMELPALATWQWLLVALLGVLAVLAVLSRPRRVRSPDFYNNKSGKSLRLRLKAFPPPYPNGWVRVCSSLDLEGGAVKSISALGRELVAFRGADGRVGVLDAYCPHLGAHLGQGGVVTASGHLKCPFHEWSFDTSGKCVSIPYCRTDVPERAKTKAYPVREHLGMVFIWFHAEEDKQEPQWEMEHHKDVLDEGRFYAVTEVQMEFAQHVLEMHMNSADFFHFQTLHRPLPLPLLDKVLFGQHELKADYAPYKDAPHVCVFNERMKEILLFGLVSVAPQAYLDGIVAHVTFEGPTIVHFSVKTPMGELRMIKTLLPVAPFKVYVESRWFAERTVPRFFAYVMSMIAARALEQDRQVWENKTYHEHPMLVSGDGPFPAFKRYYMQFYSDKSAALAKNELDW